MRSLTRIAVASAATAALGASVAVLGAGAANADVVTKTDNTIAVEGTTVSVTNTGTAPLACRGYYTNADLAGEAYKALRSGKNLVVGAEQLADAIADGEYGALSGTVEAGKTTPLTLAPATGLKPDLEAAVSCSDGATTYVFRTATPSPFGSLDLGSLGDLGGGSSEGSLGTLTVNGSLGTLTTNGSGDTTVEAGGSLGS